MMRFERAVRIGNPNLVLAAVHELPKPVQLRDALRVVLVLAVSAPEQFPAAAARFGGRLVSERRLALEEAQLVFAALGTLAGSELRQERDMSGLRDHLREIQCHRPAP
jgi:hypothetical protein